MRLRDFSLRLHHAKEDYTFPDLVLIITVILTNQINNNKVATVTFPIKCRECLWYFLEIEQPQTPVIAEITKETQSWRL